VSGFQDSTKMVFTANADGTLSSTSTIESDACALKWTVSGSTASAAANETCGGFTVNTYTFKLEDKVTDVAFAVATAVEHGTNVEADGSTNPVDLSGSFGGFCTRDGVDAGTPTICEQDPVVGCGANGVGYLCQGTSSPSSMNPAISCGQFFTDGSSCCTLGAAASSCHMDSSVTCGSGTSGYTCTGTDTPAQAASIVCDPGKAGGTDTTYCCGTYTASGCTLTGGCGDYAFDCTGAAQPYQSNFPSLRCGPANPGLSDDTIYCCSVRDPAAADTCAPDSTIDCMTQTTYGCTGTDTPSDDDPSLTCGTSVPYQGKNYYCCIGSTPVDAGGD
jgi:hypothetical protein